MERLNQRSAIEARSSPLSPGGIAGVVVGSVIGGIVFLFIFVFFINFLRRKWRERKQALLPIKEPEQIVERRLSFPSSINIPQQAATFPLPRSSSRDEPIFIGDGRAVFASPASPPGDEWLSEDQLYRLQTAPGGANIHLPPYIPRRSKEEFARRSLDHIPANADYYDLNVRMGSDTELPTAGATTAQEPEIQAWSIRMRNATLSALSKKRARSDGVIHKATRLLRLGRFKRPLSPPEEPDEAQNRSRTGSIAQISREPIELTEDLDRQRMPPPPAPIQIPASPTSPSTDHMRSPEMPEPMSGSQDVPPFSLNQTFVNPMMVMGPSTAMEKVYQTNYSLENPNHRQSAPYPSPPLQQDGAASKHAKSEQPLAADADMMDRYTNINDDERRDTVMEEANEATNSVPIVQDRASGDQVMADGIASDDSSQAEQALEASKLDALANKNAAPEPLTPGSTQDGRMDDSTTPEVSSTSPMPGALICDDCGRRFDQIHKLNHHRRYHVKPFPCAYQGCGKSFGTRTHLERHINDRHKKTKKYHCNIASCQYSVHGGKSFSRKDNWKRHMTKTHGLSPDSNQDPDEVMTGT